MDIQYISSTSTSYTVKPTQTKFTNNTDKSITLQFDGTDEILSPGVTSGKISKTLQSIKYNATVYYSNHGNNYTIAANKTATISIDGKGLKMHIP